MDGNKIGSCVAELLHIAHGLDNHQVNVQRQLSGRPEGLDDRNADGDIGHKHTVHHVHMNVIGGGNALNIPFKIREIG